jgi:hypothetical protein
MQPVWLGTIAPDMVNLMERAVGNTDPVSHRRLRWARIALIVQACALVVFIARAVPSFADYLLHPLQCSSNVLCIDLRGLDFEFSALFLGPPAILLLVTAWLWRRPRSRPAAVPLVLGVVLMGLVVYDAFTVAQSGHDQHPSIAYQIVLGLLPAAVSVALTLWVLWRHPAAAMV